MYKYSMDSTINTNGFNVTITNNWNPVYCGINYLSVLVSSLVLRKPSEIIIANDILLQMMINTYKHCELYHYLLK